MDLTNANDGRDGPPSDNDGEDDLPQVGPASNVGEKRRAQKAIFDNWLTTPAAQDVLKPRTRDGKVKDVADEEQSIDAILAQQQQATQIVKNPREYQIELFERAKKENTIAVLDTGSGKTLIAVLLLRHVIDQELENRAAGHPHRISFFLVASVTLVYQQFSVLECNLDHKVIRFCGANGTERYNKPRWEQIFLENKVVVCTAEILFQCLFHSYITMKQINLLIFDEAHHAKKNHSYARIIKDFYLPETDVSARPRIFGMTASPIDAKSDVSQAAIELEGLLDSRIATTTDMSLSEAIKKPVEEVLRYNALPRAGGETALVRDFHSRFGDIDVFTQCFKKASEIARHLGRWCTDQYLLRCFSYEKQSKYEMAIRKKFHARRGDHAVGELDESLKQVREAIVYAQSQLTTLSNTITESELSSKVLQLYLYLNREFERPIDSRCIVFVQQRNTARLLHELFLRIKTEHMRCDLLIGGSNSQPDESSFSFRQQVMTLLKFRKGETNCLFATSVAEEGLDVPDCNLVIRFDMYNTMIQYVQSRGRARNQKSKFIHMAEWNNSIHENLLGEVRYQEMAMREFCNTIPEDRRLCGNQDTVELIMEREKNLRTRTEPTTGAKLTYGNALAILANFVSAVPTEDNEPQHPTYVVVISQQKFRAEVILPGNAPIRSAIGRPETKKALAKRSAAFEACCQLRERSYLDDHLMPIYQQKLPAMRNALLAVDDKANTQYAMRVKPTLWLEGRGTLPSELWMTIIDFPDGLERAHQPLVFLTRRPMPRIPSFPVFLNDGRATEVRSGRISRPLPVTPQVLELLTTFTLRVFRDVFSKEYKADAEQFTYWLAPAASTNVDGPAEQALDWSLLNEVFANDDYKWTPDTPNEMLLNKFLVDRWDGARKFYSQGVDVNMKQTDPVPADAAKFKYSGSILDYTVSLWKMARARAVWAEGQPVIEAEKILVRRNRLAPPEAKEVTLRTKAWLVPEPLRISALTPDITASCFVWPAIIHRVEAYLVGIEACALVGVTCGPESALAAFTKDSDNSCEHDEARVNFRSGMGENYERLEFIGDTFLKTATSISTFIMNPNENEFEFHVRRMLMLCNNNLFGVACELKLYEYIRTMAFSRRLWYPEGLVLLKGTGAKDPPVAMFHENQSHALGEKTIADVCEALIGAAYFTHNQQDSWKPEDWDNAVTAVTKLVSSDDHKMLKWRDYSAAYNKPAYQTGDVTAVQKYLADKVETEHPYHFTYPCLLYSAFLHPSTPFLHERIPNYQRLEFLGDALLDQASITYLFYQYPTKDPQWLTEHKMAMVSNKFLGALCVTLGFHKHLRHHHAVLEHQVRDYATELLEAQRTASGARDFWTTVSDPPKCLPDVVEAFIGAMFVDSDFDYGVVQRFFDAHVRYYFEDMALYDSFANNHPCTHLHNLLQTTFGCSDYRLMARELPSVDGLERKDVVAVVMVHDRIIAHSAGKSGRYARLRVANLARERLDGLAPWEFRREFGCGCKEGEGVVGGGKERGLGVDCSV